MLILFRFINLHNGHDFYNVSFKYRYDFKNVLILFLEISIAAIIIFNVLKKQYFKS